MGNKHERQERQDRLVKEAGTYILSKYIGPWIKQLCIPVSTHCQNKLDYIDFEDL